MQDKRDAFLSLLDIEPGQKGFVVNLFLYPYRNEGITDAAAICRYVYSRGLEQRARHPYWQVVLDAMKDNRDIALGMAEWSVWWESLPDEKRQKIKSANHETYMLGWMEAQPPTDKQLEYLTALGCKETPETRLEASNLIEVYKSRRDKKGW